LRGSSKGVAVLHLSKLPDARAADRRLRPASLVQYRYGVFSAASVLNNDGGFESMLTTVLGQLVSVSFGRTLASELMQAAGTKVTHPKTGAAIRLFPTAKQRI